MWLTRILRHCPIQLQSIDVKSLAINRAPITKASERLTEAVYCFTPSALTTDQPHVNSKRLPDPSYAGEMLVQQTKEAHCSVNTNIASC